MKMTNPVGAVLMQVTKKHSCKIEKFEDEQ